MGSLFSCPCSEQQRNVRDHHRRLEFLQNGATFSRKKYTFGISTGSSPIWLNVHENGSRLVWTVEKSDVHGEIPWSQIQSIMPHGTLSSFIKVK